MGLFGDQWPHDNLNVAPVSKDDLSPLALAEPGSLA